MSQVDVAAVMAGLKGFQRSAVDHVIDRFYGAGREDGSGRFLVADETGLGKSIVARGVIARAIEHLETDDSVDRIDIVYVCSNRDLAQQNLRRLNVTGDEHIGMATRLSLLARDSKRLALPPPDGRKRVNLVSFTPGTSFKDGGWQTGSAPERAMLAVILDELVNVTASDRRVTRLLLQGTVSSPERFDRKYVVPLAQELDGDLDERIVGAFRRAIEADGLLAQFLELRDGARHLRRLTPELRARAVRLTGHLRRTLAKSGVDALEPDLVILDEFQRFRNLLDPSSGEAAELAHSLFNHGQAKVLLLSATPYKPFTRAGEDDEDHYSDFLSTVTFLAGGGEHAAEPVAQALRAYRQSLVTGDDVAPAALAVRETLLPLMSRSERPQLADEQDLLRVRTLDGGVPTPEDLADWAALQAMGDLLGTAIDLEYWKSIPYFASFMEGYRPAERARELLKGDDGEAVERVLAAARTVDRADVEAYRPIDLGNGYLRALCRETVDAGWWRLLWLPPTMPYLEPGPVYREFDDADITKRVIFSAWSGVPTAVASLLSYEADRRIAETSDVLGLNTAEARKSISPRLSYALREGQATAMSALALFWPHPALATLGDPLAAARAAGRRVTADEVAAGVGIGAAPEAEIEAGSRSAWENYFGTPGALPSELAGARAASLVAGLRDDDDEESGLGIGFLEHVRTALEAPPVEAFGHDGDVAALAAHAPGNIALRALRTVAGLEASERGLWTAAVALANGIRALFNRPETMALLAGLYGDDRERPYWRSVLAYCADGNLQAVLDEYVFQLHSELGGGAVDDDALAQLASSAVTAMEIRPARYVAHDATRDRSEIPFRARFALRYGGTNASDSDDASGARQAEVRAAFNSPFAPFVLASTSVGQEGIDFHWWSHSVLHWNLPSNPVDFEQREGRVNRFAGHAVRKNVAAAHWGEVLSDDGGGHRDGAGAGPWRVAFDAALARARELGEFSPWWVYPGPARIERVIASYPLSRDHARYERLRDALTLYRLTLGQPRQEDMVELLRRRGFDGGGLLTIDLRPRPSVA
jgi:hypothetical protein